MGIRLLTKKPKAVIDPETNIEYGYFLEYKEYLGDSRGWIYNFHKVDMSKEGPIYSREDVIPLVLSSINDINDIYANPVDYWDFFCKRYSHLTPYEIQIKLFNDENRRPQAGFDDVEYPSQWKFDTVINKHTIEKDRSYLLNKGFDIISPEPVYTIRLWFGEGEDIASKLDHIKDIIAKYEKENEACPAQDLTK